jgi:hypothetical protein
LGQGFACFAVLKTDAFASRDPHGIARDQPDLLTGPCGIRRGNAGLNYFSFE